MTRPTRDDVLRLLGSVDDHIVLEVLGTGAGIDDLEAVALRLAQADDVLGAARHPISGAAARVFDIVSRLEEFPEDEAPR